MEDLMNNKIEENNMDIKPLYRKSNKDVDFSTLVGSGKAGDIRVKRPPFNETFGNVRYYVVDNEPFAAALRELTGTKTLLPLHLNALKILGFNVVLVEEEKQ